MTQKYKKTVPPQFKTVFFPVSPMFYNPIYPISPMFYNPIYRISPVFFGLSMGGNMFGASKKMGALGDEVAHTGYVENISCFRG